MKLLCLLAAVSAHKLNRLDLRDIDIYEDLPDYMVPEKFTANMQGHEGHWTYERSAPDMFQGAGSGDDQFMNSMIMNYAVEKAKDGKPTGEFYFSPIAARLAGNEVVETHLGLKGDALNDYMDKYFDKTWRHFDTADNGEIEVARMGGFFRFLCANMQITLH